MDLSNNFVRHKKSLGEQIKYVFEKNTGKYGLYGEKDMQNNRFGRVACALLTLLLLFSAAVNCVSATESAELASKDQSEIRLYPGGMTFGVKFFTQGVLVVGFSDVICENGKSNPAYEAGLRTKDIITKIDGKEIVGTEAVIQAIEKADGRSISITFVRDGKENTVTLTPAFSVEENKYKTGMWIRDSGAGIGTVTYIDPETYGFAGLGHGICDVDTGELMPISHGSVMNVTLYGISKGAPGSPGELKGHFSGNKTGELFGNSECGVFGRFSSLPDTYSSEPLPIAKKNEVKTGEAHILCTIAGNEIKDYKIEITAINKRDSDTKNFSLKITDPTLLEASGGIVQGMSGSPIIQDGKLVGAVTHVCVNP